MKAIICIVVVLCAGCASVPEEPLEPSVFELIVEAEFGPTSVNVCPSGGVTYCIGDGTGVDRCGCADAFDVQKQLERAFW
jgi:hypothetical protein